MSRAKDGERPLIDQAVAPRSDLGWRAGLGDHAAGRTVQQPSGGAPRVHGASPPMNSAGDLSQRWAA